MWMEIYFVYLLMILKGVTTLKVIRPSDNATSWVEAQADCVGQGGDLLLMNEESIRAIERCNFSSTEMFWEGRYNTFSSWVIYKGCVQRPSNSDIASVLQLQIPGSVECAEHCRSYNYLFGIQNETCYCFKPSFSYIEMNDTDCHIKCSLRGEPCGGHNYISVYQEVPAREVQPREDDLQPFDILCGLTECTPPNWRFYGYPCDRSLNAICNDDEVLSSNQNWISSQNNCWQLRDKTLGGINLVGRVSCSNAYQFVNTPLWIQMRRDKVTRTVDGREVVPESTCFGGMIDNGTFSERDMDCSHKHIYVCVIDTDSPNCTDCAFNETDIIPSCDSTTESYTSIMSTDDIMTTDQEETSASSVTTEKLTPSAAPIQSTDNPGAIVGGTVGGVTGLLCCLMAIRICLRRKHHPKTPRETYVSDEAKEDGRSSDHESSKPINELDISKESTLLVRPTAQPSRQTDYVKTEGLVDTKPTKDETNQTKSIVNELDSVENIENRQCNSSDGYNDSDIDEATNSKNDLDHVKVEEVLQHNDLESEEAIPVNKETETVPPQSFDESVIGTSIPQNTQAQQDNTLSLDSTKNSESDVKIEKALDNDRRTDVQGDVEPAKSPQKEESKNSPDKEVKDKPKMVSVINIGPIARSDIVIDIYDL